MSLPVKSTDSRLHFMKVVYCLYRFLKLLPKKLTGNEKIAQIKIVHIVMTVIRSLNSPGIYVLQAALRIHFVSSSIV